MMVAAVTGGDVTLSGASLSSLAVVGKVLEQAGVIVEEGAGGIRVRNGADGVRISGVDVMTEPFPGFPTDLQAQMMSVMTVAEGAAMITETIFENRFMHVPELCRMGANINVHGSSALVRGVRRLTGAPVMATDLRASVSLVLAGSPPRARRSSAASIIWIAAMSGWRRSSRPAGPRSSGCRTSSAVAGRRLCGLGAGTLRLPVPFTRLCR